MFDRFKRKYDNQPVALPDAIMVDDNPVNYDSVLDYLVGLSGREFDKLQKIASIYRTANKEAAKILGVKDQPTTQLKDEAPNEDQVEGAIDQLLEMPTEALREAIENAPARPSLKKQQSPSSETKIKVSGE